MKKIKQEIVEGGEKLYCTECGSKIDGRFCANCGTQVQGTEGKQEAKITRLIVIGAIVLVAFIVGIILLAGDSTPEVTVKNYLYALRKGDLDRLVSTIDPIYLDGLGEQRASWEQQVQQWLDETSSKWKENKVLVRIVDSTKVEGVAVVKVQIKNRDNVGEKRLLLAKHGNRWYIVSLSFLDWYNKDWM